jgi:hypothetical protein
MALSSLFKNKDAINKNCHPMCFYLKWTESGPVDIPKYIAQWTNLDQLDRTCVKWKANVKWKEIGEITLATDYIPGSDPLDPSYLVGKGADETPSYSNVSYIKSHLQKCIRRSCVGKALKTAIQFLHLEPIDFLRRLCIIAIEDALPLDGFSTLVWLMAASSKEYCLTSSHVGWLLGYVHDLAKCPYYEQIDHTMADTTIRSLRLFRHGPNGRNLCYSIMLRHSYGGMKGDKAMCHSNTVLWHMRFNTKSRFLDLLNRQQTFITFPTTALTKGEWLPAAIDFHCYTNICNHLWEKHDTYTVDQIRDAIWHCSSCLTNKKNIAQDLGQRQWDNKDYQKVWHDIKRDFNGIARYIINAQHTA